MTLMEEQLITYNVRFPGPETSLYNNQLVILSD